MFCSIELRVDDCLAKELPQPLDQVQIRRIRRKEDLLDFRAFYLFPELFIAIITGIFCDDVDVFGLGVPLLSRLVKGNGGIGIDAWTLMGYDVCHVMRIKQSVDVDTVPTAHGGLLQTFALLDPSIGRACV